MRAVMESEWPQLAQKLPAGRWMRHWGLSSRRGGKPGDRGRQCAALRRMQHDYLSARPADLSATAGICHDATGVWRVMTKRTSAPRPAEGIPARQVGACHNALLSPGPQCVTTELTQAEKCGLLMVKVAIPVAQLYLVHVFQRSIPAGFFAPRFPTTTTKTPVQRSTVARSTRVDLR